MNGLDEYNRLASEELSKGMKPGAFAKLKEIHPKVLAETEAKLAANFTKEGITDYKEALIRGFKNIGYWNE
ncbi:hypothetical protein KAR91_49370 [Candidatus Pacearchaeota archaeon]|nr:hypothetical protein [Candidatus Pacearchaeota archaeon]